MKTNSKRLNGLLSIFALATVVALSFSCKKEKTQPISNPAPNGTTNAVVLEATADIHYVTEGTEREFKYYHNLSHFPSATIIDDSTLLIVFHDTDTNGESHDDEATIVIEITDRNGFQVGNLYSIADNPASHKVLFSLDYGNPSAEVEEFSRELHLTNYTANGPQAAGLFKITAISEENIQGSFTFEGTTSSQQPMEIGVSAGEFNCILQRINE